MSLLDDFIASVSGTTPAGLATVPAGERAPLDLNAIGGGLSSVGLGVSSVSRLMQGVAQRQAASATAGQLRQNADAAAASSERTAADIATQTQLITSRALAVAAGSGGGASDPTVIDLIARDAQRGAYMQSVALYGGQDRARALNAQADVTEYEGKAAERTGIEEGVVGLAGGATNLLKTYARGSSLYEKFGRPVMESTGQGGT